MYFKYNKFANYHNIALQYMIWAISRYVNKIIIALVYLSYPGKNIRMECKKQLKFISHFTLHELHTVSSGHSHAAPIARFVLCPRLRTS